MTQKVLVFFLALSLLAGTALAQGPEGFVFGDPLPDAPALAPRGDFPVGVQTLELVNPGQPNVLGEGVYDRPLTVEVWYPAEAGAEQAITYDETLGRADVEGSLRPFSFAGRAARDAAPDASGAPYPLVIVSHGYPGSRFMMTYLTENLASKGYVVAAIDHTESTFRDANVFASTLVHRPFDQIFVIDEMARLSADGASFLNGLVDADNTAIVGYSMGGYGALNVIGAGYNPILANTAGPGSAPRLVGAEGYAADPRVKAAVLFAPFGGDLTAAGFPGLGFFDPPAMEGISIPTFWIAGSNDDVAIYAGIVKLFDASVNSERHLLTYESALHNVAPNPPPTGLIEMTLPEYERYAEPAWDEARINNVNQHFITAFLGVYLKADESMAQYLDLAVENAEEGVWKVDGEGNPTPEHTYWAGFSNRTALGMSLRAGE